MENIQYALLIERVVASVFVEWYETATSFLGWLLSLCCIALTLTKVTYFFWHESFSVPTVNGLSKPATLVELMNSFFIFSIATNGISLVVCAALYTVNKRENTRRTFKLPCRFRSEENVSSVFLVGGILATHSCVFLFYRCSYLLTNVIATTPHELEVYRSASHMQANGADGWNNYASVLESQWNRP
ncbi:hypothetical protein ANCCAN_12628 [Ancylostoma caninum]|uniref:Serpentine receptor class gamma n=1 Tax=Ancylostoma caninum TaxID=29170 RepID=A0A368GEE6_ANCCA|nr:hypothetical protein ANCCAN_12628 [Ancylostoma caninum]